jgi:hypothetical protein
VRRHISILKKRQRQHAAPTFTAPSVTHTAIGLYQAPRALCCLLRVYIQVLTSSLLLLLLLQKASPPGQHGCWPTRSCSARRYEGSLSSAMQ